jgi:hypothetical protein
MDENQRLEFDRQESARQAHADFANREKYCPNCSGVSPMGGNCSSCMAMMAAAERRHGGLPATRLPKLRDTVRRRLGLYILPNGHDSSRRRNT